MIIVKCSGYYTRWKVILTITISLDLIKCLGSGSLDPQHFGLDPDPQTYAGYTDPDPKGQNLDQNLQKKYVALKTQI